MEAGGVGVSAGLAAALPEEEVTGDVAAWTAGVMSGLTLACIAMLFRKSGAAKTDATIPVLHRMRRYEDISRRGDSKS